jgi:hypothetical protein
MRIVLDFATRPDVVKLFTAAIYECSQKASVCP